MLRGILFMSMFGLSSETQQNLIRNAGGNSELETIIRLLRTSELSQDNKPRQAHFQTWDGDDEEDDWNEEEEEEEGYMGDDWDEEEAEENEKFNSCAYYNTIVLDFETGLHYNLDKVLVNLQKSNFDKKA